MNEEHEPGRCTVCGEEKPVRWKNLYTIGSEGTWMCMKCERLVLHFINDLMRKFGIARKEKFKKAKKRGN